MFFFLFRTNIINRYYSDSPRCCSRCFYSCQAKQNPWWPRPRCHKRQIGRQPNRRRTRPRRYTRALSPKAQIFSFLKEVYGLQNFRVGVKIRRYLYTLHVHSSDARLKGVRHGNHRPVSDGETEIINGLPIVTGRDKGWKNYIDNEQKKKKIFFFTNFIIIYSLHDFPTHRKRVSVKILSTRISYPGKNAARRVHRTGTTGDDNKRETNKSSVRTELNNRVRRETGTCSRAGSACRRHAALQSTNTIRK